jgi:hypothetical protein
LCALLLGGFWCRDLGLGFLLGLGLFKILDGQLKQLEPCCVQKIARPARAVPWPASASVVRFPGGRRSLSSSPALAVALRKDHRARGGKVGGKRIGGRRHDDDPTIFAAKNPAGFPS